MAPLTEAQKKKQTELRVRELRVVSEHELYHGTADLQTAHRVITEDRLERWEPVMAAIKVPGEIMKWAAMMAAAYGPEVLMHRRPGLPGYRVDWITALVLVRYGESEYFWPTALGKDDFHRARMWMNGSKTPGVITYIPKKED